MKEKLHVLVIEDEEPDAILNVHYLERAGYSIHFRRVDTAEEMENALELEKWNLILSDYSMPFFDVNAALEIYNHAKLDIPFIVISGEIGEERAVELIKSGVHDYLTLQRNHRYQATGSTEPVRL